jgi:hypothetical protein
LLLIAVLWLLLIPIYAWPIWQTKRPPTAGSVYRIWPKDRVEVQEQKPTLDNPARIEQLHARGYLAAIGWSAYFSLLSAFQIGYREFSAGSWLSRAQPRNFTLESTGWVDGVRYPVSTERLSVRISFSAASTSSGYTGRRALTNSSGLLHLDVMDDESLQRGSGAYWLLRSRRQHLLAPTRQPQSTMPIDEIGNPDP